MSKDVQKELLDWAKEHRDETASIVDRMIAGGRPVPALRKEVEMFKAILRLINDVERWKAEAVNICIVHPGLRLLHDIANYRYGQKEK